ncbi:hypothetical protein H4O18_18830 [Arenibacter sp. BSSL-BM3]|uniref:Uncharacterized protein n=1 Tax=Arenibacter arenosicollis TaxID=2762274 RepID=A0ABR7QSA2_9FLAO|nr:hypothetical protein [Arenibacter arenosicollis]MBC8770062.1 hypothetical protein [Arenibacter arenosicollis]
MEKKILDKKQSEENTELVKEKNDPKTNYIFQKNGITRTGFIIIVMVLILIILGITLSGAFFESTTTNP